LKEQEVVDLLQIKFDMSNTSVDIVVVVVELLADVVVVLDGPVLVVDVLVVNDVVVVEL
jgi:hypothetical protein